MTAVRFVLPDGRERTIDVADGTSLMVASVQAGIPGIIGECGGSAACATCHGYVQASEGVVLPPPDAVEDEMLEATAAPRTSESRLCCQVKMRAHFAGLVVRLPDRQI